MAEGKRAGKRGSGAPGISRTPLLPDALQSQPREALGGQERAEGLKEAKHPHVKPFSYLISLYIKSEMLLSGFYCLFPKSKLVVLEKITLSGRRLQKGQGLPICHVPQGPPFFFLDTSSLIRYPSVTGKALPT